MHKLIYFGLLVVFFSACKKDPVITDNADLPYLVFSEEVVAQPVIHNNEFRVLSNNEEGLHLIKIDTDGNKTELCALEPVLTENNVINYSDITLLSSSDNGNFIVFSYYTYTETDSVATVGLLKTDSTGNLLWQNTAEIQVIGASQLPFNNAFPTADGGLALFFAQERGPITKNFNVKISLFDANGINTQNSISEPFAGSISSIFMDSNQKVFVFPTSENTQPRNGQSDLTTYILDKNASLTGSKILPISVSDISAIYELGDNYLLTGISVLLPGEQTGSASLLDSDFNLLFTSSFSTTFAYYSFTKTDSHYITTGAYSSQARTQEWSSLYEETGNTAAWAFIDETGQVESDRKVYSEFSTIAVSCIAKSDTELYVLAVRKSFSTYNDLIFINTSIN